MDSPMELTEGDEVRVLAFSRSLEGIMRGAGFTEDDVDFAVQRIESVGLEVTFGRWVRECDEHLNASLEHRLEDFNDALLDPDVKAVLAVSGGIGAIQMLDALDYERIAAHPKIFCGYSDFSYLANAIAARSGLITCYGPNFSSFMMREGAGYMLDRWRDCLFGVRPMPIEAPLRWSDDAWHECQDARTFHGNEGFWPIQAGEAEGMLVGGNGYCLNMLQGTPYFPSIDGAILMLELRSEGKVTLMALDSCLRSLSFQPGFRGVRGIMIGRLSLSAGVSRGGLARMIAGIPALAGLPVVGNCDFGHTTPIATLPIGGRCVLRVGNREASVILAER